MRRWLRLAPALAVLAVLFGSSVTYGVSQSLGYLPFLGERTLTLAAYRNIFAGADYAQEFWAGLGFALWVSAAATLGAVALTLALLALVGARLRSTPSLVLLNLSLGLPHLVWAVALALLLSQSGLVARLAAALGLISGPASFPVLVRDRFGAGIILSYIWKETPFLLLVALSILRAQTDAYDLVARTLGAGRWQRLRWVTLPLVGPGLLAAALLVFAFVFGAYEVPAVLGVRQPRMLAVLALELFSNPDLHSRAEGMAISVVMAVAVLGVAALAARWRAAA